MCFSTYPIEAGNNMNKKIDPPPMTRRERKKLETKNKIMFAALSLFASEGYDNVRVEDICEHADVANATFFAYFPTKASLIQTFGDDLMVQVNERLAEFDAGALESLEILRAIYFDAWAEHRELLRRFVSNPQSPEALAIAASGEALFSLTTEIIEQGQQDAEISPQFEAALIARCLVFGWRGVLVNFAGSADVRKTIKNGREVLDIILLGVSAASRDG